MPLKNSQYDIIMREYSRRQLQSENDLIRRKEEVYFAVPRIKDIEDEIVSSSAYQAKLRIKGDMSGAAEYKKHIENICRERDTLLVENGFPADYLLPRYVCSKCRDLGYIGGRKCSCYLQAATNLLYSQSGLDDILEKENFDKLTFRYYSNNSEDSKNGRTVYENMTMIVNACKKYVEDFSEKKGNILFTGDVGCGKTYLTHCIAKALMDKCISVMYLTATQLFEIFGRADYSREDSTEIDISHNVYDCELLIIDDLGTENPNGLIKSRLFTCINERNARNLGTIISTNLSLKEIRDEYSDRIYSRIVGNYSCYTFYGKDIRLIKRYGKRY